MLNSFRPSWEETYFEIVNKKKYKDFELTEKIANHANINLIYKGEK